jgi:hypothetical protein
VDWECAVDTIILLIAPISATTTKMHPTADVCAIISKECTQNQWTLKVPKKWCDIIFQKTTHKDELA